MRRPLGTAVACIYLTVLILSLRLAPSAGTQDGPVHLIDDYLLMILHCCLYYRPEKDGHEHKRKRKKQQSQSKRENQYSIIATHVVSSKCFRATLADYQPGSLDQRSVCQNAVCQNRRVSAEVWESVPERLHIDGSLEHEESVSAVVGVEHLTIRAKVLGTERTAVPLSNDTSHMPVAEGKCMCEVAKISCFDAHKQLP